MCLFKFTKWDHIFHKYLKQIPISICIIIIYSFINYYDTRLSELAYYFNPIKMSWMAADWTTIFYIALIYKYITWNFYVKQYQIYNDYIINFNILNVKICVY